MTNSQPTTSSTDYSLSQDDAVEIEIAKEIKRLAHLEQILAKDIPKEAIDYILQSLKDPAINKMFIAELASQGTTRVPFDPAQNSQDDAPQIAHDTVELPSLAHETVLDLTKFLNPEVDIDHSFDRRDPHAAKELVVVDRFLKRISGVDVNDHLLNAKALNSPHWEDVAISIQSSDPQKAQAIRKHKNFLQQFGMDVVFGLEGGMNFRAEVRERLRSITPEQDDKAFLIGFYAGYLEGPHEPERILAEWNFQGGDFAQYMDEHTGNATDYFQDIRRDILEGRQDLEAGEEVVIYTTLRIAPGHMKAQAQELRADRGMNGGADDKAPKTGRLKVS